jgi:hypothetical protein
MNFKTITVSDYGTIKAFFAQNPYNLSIYSPASLIAWSNQMQTARYGIFNGKLLISGELAEHPDERYLILPVSAVAPRSAAVLHTLARELGFERYWYVPGDFLETLNRSELNDLFILEEQTQYEDYIYLTEDLTCLKGNKFSKKRNLIHQFSREYLNRNRVMMQTILAEHVEECLDFLENWCERHICDVDQEFDLACEKKAMSITLKNLELFESMGILIRIDGKIAALGIGSRLNRTTATLNFEKAFSDIKGLYQYLDNECAKRLFSEYKYVNKESDMNIPNLAESKQSYNPILRIKSFALLLR